MSIVQVMYIIMVSSITWWQKCYPIGLILYIMPLNIYERKLSRLTLLSPNYSIWIFTHFKLCLANAIHNFKWVKIIQIWQNGGKLFSNRADWCHIMALTCLKGGIECGDNWVKNPINAAPAVKGLNLCKRWSVGRLDATCVLGTPRYTTWSLGPITCADIWPIFSHLFSSYMRRDWNY